MTAKKSTKKSAARSAFLVLLIQPFAFLFLVSVVAVVVERAR